MKKLLSVSCCAVLCLMMAGCNDSPQTTNENNKNSVISKTTNKVAKLFSSSNLDKSLTGEELLKSVKFNKNDLKDLSEGSLYMEYNMKIPMMGNKTVNTKTYRVGDKTRVITKNTDSEKEDIYVSNGKENFYWNTETKKGYMNKEMPEDMVKMDFDEEADNLPNNPTLFDLTKEMGYANAVYEEVNGRDTIKFSMNEEGMETEIWMDVNYFMPVKMVGKMGENVMMEMEMVELKQEDVDDDLFDKPSDVDFQ